MNPFKVKCLFFTESYALLFSSLQRYFNYILDQKLNPFSQTELLNSTALFVYKDEKENPELIKLVSANKNLIIVLLDYDKKSNINLLDLTVLEKKLLGIFDLNITEQKSLFTDEELKEKLKNFFHSHGEESLFEVLNLSYYLLMNGPEQLLLNEISFEEYQDVFLIPALKQWGHFKSRLAKYNDIIKLSNYKATLKDLENAINEVDSYVTLLLELNSQNMIEKKSNFFKNQIEKFKRIDDILIAFYRKLSFEESPLQNITGR